jgi:surface antigen
VVIALALGGCGVSMPIGSLIGDAPADGLVTGSTGVEASGDLAAIDPRLDAEDRRRAEAALALALDPAGQGVPVNWDNPTSGARGAFRSDGEFYLSGDRLCRRFEADLAPRGADSLRRRGAACRNGPGQWRIDGLAEGAAATGASASGEARAADPAPLTESGEPPA